MKLEIYSFYDSKTKVHTNPFYVPNRDVAMRVAQHGVANMDTDLAQFPRDFTLCYHGSFDNATSKFDIVKSGFEEVCNMGDFLLSNVDLQKASA